MKFDGIIAANTTTTREGLTIDDTRIRSVGNGGLSGRPVKDRIKI